MEKQTSSYRWIVFSAVLLSYFLIVSQRTAPGLITDRLMSEFQISATIVGLIASIQFLAYSGLQIPVGLLSDRFGPNHFLIIGTLLTGLGTVFYSVATHEYLLIFSRLLVGLGDAAIWINLVLIFSEWFKVKEFTKLLGIAGIAGNLGALLATVPFSIIISLTGWRTPFFATGILLCLTAILLFFVLEKKPKQFDNHQAKSRRSQTETKEKTWTILLRVLSNHQAWAAFLCHFGIAGTYIGFIGSWGVPYGMYVLELSRSSASQLMMYGIFGTIVGSIFISWFTGQRDNIKHSYLFLQMIFFISWATIFIVEKPSYWVAVILFFLMGFGVGGGPLTFAVVRRAFPLKEVGVVTGFANTGGFISAVLLPFFFGKVLDSFQHAPDATIGYHYGLMIPVLFSFMGLIGVSMIKEKKQHKQPSIKTTGIL